jgi:hypothetical protein
LQKRLHSKIVNPDDRNDDMVDFVKKSKWSSVVAVLRAVWRRIAFVLFYFGPQARFDRKLQKTALNPASIAKSKKELSAYYAAKKEAGRVRIQHGGTIEAPPFPVHGSLLTDEEKADVQLR